MEVLFPASKSLRDASVACHLPNESDNLRLNRGTQLKTGDSSARNPSMPIPGDGMLLQVNLCFTGQLA